MALFAECLYIHCLQIELEHRDFFLWREENRRKSLNVKNSTHIWRRLWDLTPGHIGRGECSPHSIFSPILMVFLMFLVREGEYGPDGKIAMSVEHRLLQDLIYNPSYSREVRPALRNEDVLKVAFSLKLVQIVDVVSYEELPLFSIIAKK